MTTNDDRTPFQGRMCHHLANGQVAEADELERYRCPKCAGAGVTDDGGITGGVKCDVCGGDGMLAAGTLRDGETAEEAVARVESAALFVACINVTGGDMVNGVRRLTGAPAVTATRAMRRLVADGRISVVHTETVYRATKADQR